MSEVQHAPAATRHSVHRGEISAVDLMFEVARRECAEAELAERVQLATLVSDVACVLARGGKLADVLHQCADRIARGLAVAGVQIWTLSGDGQLDPVVTVGTGADGSRLLDRIASGRQPLRIDASDDAATGSVARLSRSGLTAFAGYPLSVDDHVVGILAVSARRALSACAHDALVALADAIAVGVSRLRAEEALRDEARVSGVLARAGAELIDSLGSPHLSDRICELLAYALGSDCSFAILQRDDGVFVRRGLHGFSAEQRQELQAIELPPEDLAALAARLGKERVLQLSADALVPNLACVASRYDVRSLLYVALRRGDDVIGVLGAGHRGRERRFSGQQVQIACAVAQLASVVLENARLIDSLRCADALKSEFVATMSHELRTPLNIIMGYADLLLERGFGPLTYEQEDALGHVLRSGRRLLELISSTLDLSRLERGQLPIERTEVDLGEELRELVAELMRDERRTAPALRLEIACDLPPIVTDRTKVRAVVRQLLDNAVKFTAADGEVEITARPASGGIEVVVRDTGAGIAPDVVPIIFERFRQGDASSTRRYEGVGLGLYIVRRLLDVLGGKVGVPTEIGHGSRFRVWLPLDAGDAVPPASRDQAHDPAPPARHDGAPAAH